ncbi:MAG: hypothetical protein KJ737_07585 [Proteobacteria bacterium]|nr:hypothetical protein [Pseudomonadota bacterium]
MQKEIYDTANVCTCLFWRLSSKGIPPKKIQHLIYDVFNLLREGGSFTVATVNYELEQIGWETSLIDDYCFELIIYILEKEFGYKVTKRVLH